MDLIATIGQSIPRELATVATVGIFITFLKWAIDKLIPTIETFQEVVKRSMDANTETVKENHAYLKKRNGSLERSNEQLADKLESIAETQRHTAEKLEELDRRDRERRAKND